MKSVVVLILLALTAPLASAANDPPKVDNPLLRHMERSLTGDASQWRTSNPGYQEGGGAPSEFGLRFRMEPDQRHVTGELTGIYPDGREVVFWSMLSFYNPVTEKVIAQQIGWDGTLVRGEVPLQPGPEQVIDMTSYAATGAMKRTCHRIRFTDADAHTAEVYEIGADGEWQLLREWSWRRTPTPDAKRPTAGPGASAATPSKLAPWVEHLLSGSGQWRADNPGYEEGGDAPRQYGMNYRWGPNRQHVIAEIVSLYADGRREKEWSLYITYNPVTGVAALEQTGRVGLYFRGEMSHAPDGEHVESGLIYLPNGAVKSVRDRNRMIDPDTRLAKVYERDAKGGWELVREWTWTQQ